MTSTSQPGTRHVLVIDDSPRFALQVWRYLSGTPGFGAKGVLERDENEKVSRRAVDDGRFVVWWIDTESRDEPDTEALLDHTIKKLNGEAIALALVDHSGRRRRTRPTGSETDPPGTDPPRAESGTSPPSKQPLRYNWRSMWLKLHAQLGDETHACVRIISAYKAGSERFTIPTPSGAEKAEPVTVLVHPKSHQLIHGLLRPLRCEPAPLHIEVVKDKDKPTPAHVLVTGAGFEIGSAEAGLGVPSTPQMLRSMFRTFLPGLRIRPDSDFKDRCKSPIGSGSLSEQVCDHENSGPKHESEGILVDKASSRGAKAQDGDAIEGMNHARHDRPTENSAQIEDQTPPIFPVPYDDQRTSELRPHYEHLVTAAFQGNLDDYFSNLFLFLRAHHPQSDDGRRKSHDEELNIREAFRQVLLQYDWGQMRQSLAAAELPWTGWISTNYTGFSDRAIRAVAQHQQWQVVSSAEEAQSVLAAQLDIRSRTNHSYDTLFDEIDRRTMFKVHGDIGDVRTMALAGHDKTAFNPLWVSIGSLHKLYIAAQEFLKTKLRRRTRIFFHIVGHDLKDRNLVAMLREVIRDLRPDGESGRQSPEQSIVLVNVDMQGPLQKLLDGGLLPHSVELSILPLTAAEYMARLRRLWSEQPYFDRATLEQRCATSWPWRTFPSNSDEQIEKALHSVRDWRRSASA